MLNYSVPDWPILHLLLTTVGGSIQHRNVIKNPYDISGKKSDNLSLAHLDMERLIFGYFYLSNDTFNGNNKNNNNNCKIEISDIMISYFSLIYFKLKLHLSPLLM